MQGLLRVWREALHDSTACLWRGFVDVLSSPRLMIRSSLLCVLSAIVWAIAFYHYKEILGYALLFLSFICAFGLLLGGFQGFLAFSFSGGNNVSASVTGGLGSLVSGVQALLLVAAVVLALYVVVYLFLVSVTIRVALPAILLTPAKDVVSRRQQKYLPAGTRQSTASSRPTWKKSLTIALLLLLPAVAGITIVLMLCYFNVRLLYATVESRFARYDSTAISSGANWRPLLLIGIMQILLLCIPLINLVIPALMCTSVLRLHGLDSGERLELN